jgi:hypothetical protein
MWLGGLPQWGELGEFVREGERRKKTKTDAEVALNNR